jgi:hypothetical protein
MRTEKRAEEFSMKNLLKLFEAVIMAAIVLSTAACTTDADGGGSLTITGIPGQYNGNYAFFSGNISGFDVDDGGAYNRTVLGCQSIDMSTFIVTLVEITDGSVTLPMFTNKGNPYSGTPERSNGKINIFTSPTIDLNTPLSFSSLAYRDFSDRSFNFSNGSATISWNDGW